MSRGPFPYGRKSQAVLDSCDERIQHVFGIAARWMDISCIEGHRTAARQQELFNTRLPDGSRVTLIDGVNQLSKHNYDPSQAIDALPHPLTKHGVSVWYDRARLSLFAGSILTVARYEDIPMAWGGDWDGDWSSANHKFFDGPHFQLLERWP